MTISLTVPASSLSVSARIWRKLRLRAVSRTYMSAEPVLTSHFSAVVPTSSGSTRFAGSVTLIAAIESFLKKSAGRALITWITLPFSSVISIPPRRPLIRSIRTLPLLPAMVRIFVMLRGLPRRSTLTSDSMRASSSALEIVPSRASTSESTGETRFVRITSTPSFAMR